ncbi:MAG: AgmX/PglI C-terminal domain-containing protein [Byssovorax sp.]
MASLWERFREGGWPNWLIVLLGMLGFLAGAAALIAPLVSKKRLAALVPGLLAAAAACAILLVGMGGMLWGLHRVDSALAGAGVRPIMVERIYRMGLHETKSCLEFALFFAAFPALGALVALLLSTRRKGDALPPPGGPYANLPPPAPPSNIAAFLAIGVMPLFFAGTAALHMKQAPGQDLDDESYQVIDALDAVTDGAPVGGCRRIADFERLPPSSPARSRPELGELAERCAQADLDSVGRVLEAVGGGARLSLSAHADAQRTLNAWKSSSLPLSAEIKVKLDVTLGRLAEVPSEPTDAPGLGGPAGSVQGGLRMGATQVTGRLPPEVIQRIVRQNFSRMRACYERALKRDPALGALVTTRFVINQAGDATSVETTSEPKIDREMIDCVSRTFKALKFPSPESGVVTVVFPIRFTAG